MKTKTIYLVMSICLISHIANLTSVFAQNLVPNPGFDVVSPCPTGLSQTGSASPWAQPTVGTSDVFNTCNTGTGCTGNQVGVPTNHLGTQTARSNNGYAGFYTYNSSDPDYREYVQVALPSLTAGVSYDVVFYVSLAEINLAPCGVADTWATNNIGAYLSTTAPTSGGTTNLLFTPQINSTSVISNTTGWAPVSGTFTPTVTGVHYITIGNFFDDASTTTTELSTDFFNNKGYYYIDDVCVGTTASAACPVVPLPIQLVYFTGSCVAQNAIQLHWNTATETNNDYFTIERSTSPNPSKGGGLNWEVAGTVKGAGNSSTTKNYEFIDNSLPFGEGQGGVVYYRLRQTDFDGKTETFNDKQVAVDVTECAVKVFPNPAGNTLNIPYAAEQDGEITLQVYDVIGKLVKDKTVDAVKGNNKFTLDLTTVAQGMYVLKVKTSASGKEQNQKFIKQ